MHLLGTEAKADTSGKDFGEYSADHPLELKLSHFAASEENQLAILANTFADYVSQESGGAVKVTVIWVGEHSVMIRNHWTLLLREHWIVQ